MTAARDYAALREAAARLRGDGIQRVNEGIDIGTWEPSEREFECPTLPGEEHRAPLNERTWRTAA